MSKKLSVQYRIQRQVEVFASKVDFRAITERLEETYNDLTFSHQASYSEMHGAIAVGDKDYIVQLCVSPDSVDAGYNLFQIRVFPAGEPSNLEKLNVDADELVDDFVALVAQLIHENIRNQKRVESLIKGFTA